MIDWTWYWIGCILSPPTVLFWLWFWNKVGLIEFTFKIKSGKKYNALVKRIEYKLKG